jgi:hypothetical protein
MIAVLTLALAAAPDPITAPSELRIAFGGCPHADVDIQHGRESITRYLDSVTAANADDAWLLGDIAGKNTDAGWRWQRDDSFPTTGARAIVRAQIDAHAWPESRLHAVGGNHDGSPHVHPDDHTCPPGVTCDRPFGWLADTLDPLTADGVIHDIEWSTPGAYVVEYRLTDCDRRVRVVAISDSNGQADRAACGRRSHATEFDVEKGMPAGNITPEQVDLIWRELRVADNETEAGRPTWVIVVAHHVPPETTVGSWSGEGRRTRCRGNPDGSGAQHYHGRHRPASWVFGRPSLHQVGADGLTSEERCDLWGGALAYVGDSPMPRVDWMRELLGQVVEDRGSHRLLAWFGAHTHLRNGHDSIDGHTVHAHLQPTRFGAPVGDPALVVQVGGLTAWHAGGTPQHVVATLTCPSDDSADTASADVGMLRADRWVVEDYAACGHDHVIPPGGGPAPMAGVAPLVVPW